MKKRIIIYIVIAQIIIISGIGFNILQKKKKVLGEVSVNPISKDEIIASVSGNLKYFYEPRADTTDNEPYSVVLKANHTINSDALNERVNYAVDKPSGVFRIITLGDSFTFGLHVDTKDNWTELLEDKLNSLACKNIKKFEVINLGMMGYDNVYSLERYRLRGEKYNPDLIIWYEVEMIRLKERTRPLEDEYFNDIQEKRKKENSEIQAQDYLDAVSKAQKDVVKQFGETAILNLQIGKIKELNGITSKPILLILDRNIPDYQQDYIRQALQKYKSKDFIENISLNNPKLIFSDGHPNYEGQKVILENILSYLNKNKLIPCN